MLILSIFAAGIVLPSNISKGSDLYCIHIIIILVQFFASVYVSSVQAVKTQDSYKPFYRGLLYKNCEP
jgi:hypothetical protein